MSLGSVALAIDVLKCVRVLARNYSQSCCFFAIILRWIRVSIQTNIFLNRCALEFVWPCLDGSAMRSVSIVELYNTYKDFDLGKGDIIVIVQHRRNILMSVNAGIKRIKTHAWKLVPMFKAMNWIVKMQWTNESLDIFCLLNTLWSQYCTCYIFIPWLYSIFVLFHFTYCKLK